MGRGTEGILASEDQGLGIFRGIFLLLLLRALKVDFNMEMKWNGKGKKISQDFVIQKKKKRLICYF